MSQPYPIISADSHITEPPDCYTAHIDPRFRDQAPHMVTDDRRGSMFVIPGMRSPIAMGLVAAAGNQLIGEALHLGKPLLVLPEAAHAEQLMNAHFLAGMQCGDFCLLEQATVDRVRAFVDGLDRFGPALARVAGRMDGTADVLSVIRRRLAAPAERPVQASR